ncbi:fimbrial biogenesis chaperone [Sandarakinorhabdus sp.]|uniref:fimbrial biogenesis chaperone n=1 Tax=Sandarakinorhabdus sp. TaxID=1916663 RepID=UPI003F70D277
MTNFLRAAVLAALATAAPAAAELLVAPTRVILTPTTRTAELVLVNKGTEAAAFRLALENRRMRSDGGLEAAADTRPDEKFAADKLRFSPRQLVLEPGARQVVRIMAAAGADLPQGEYRSHLRLMSAPISAGRTQVAAPGAGASAAPGADNSLSIELIAIRSITIPVILRVGKLDASVAVDGASLAQDASNQLVVKLTRQGTRSTYGDISLTVDGEKQPAWLVRGVAIYTPNTSRDVILPLPPETRAKLAGKRVRIAYVSTDGAEPALAGTVLASLTAAL